VLIRGAVPGVTTITTEFMTQRLSHHPRYDPANGL
jgi:hypothetical protein